jgi:hypothetical protein
MKNLLTLCFAFYFSAPLFSQNVSINAAGSSADPSAILDISSDDKGVLIPRMSSTDRNNISNPVLGLLVFCTDCNPSGVYQYTGTAWRRITGSKLEDQDTDTYIQVEATPDDDKIRFATNNANRMIIDNNGMIGIGTINPVYKLDLFGSGNRLINMVNHSVDPGDATGLFSIISGSGAGTRRGVYSIISASGNDVHYGFTSDMSGSGTGQHMAYYAHISGTGTGGQYGSSINIANNSNGNHYAAYNSLYGTGSGQHTGVLNSLSGAGTGSQYGVYNTINNSGNQTHFGITNLLTGSGTGEHTGTKNELGGTGTGVQYGTLNIISNSGDNPHYGVSSGVWGPGTGTHYGCRNLMSGSGTGYKYAVYGSTSTASGNTKYAGYFDGNVTVIGTFSNPSDQKLKTNIHRASVSNSLEKLRSIHIYQYNYNRSAYPFMSLPETPQTGFLAQELQEAFPELVSINVHPEYIPINEEDPRPASPEVEYLGVNSIGLIPHLISAIQEQQALIEQLQQTVEELKANK